MDKVRQLEIQEYWDTPEDEFIENAKKKIDALIKKGYK